MPIRIRFAEGATGNAAVDFESALEAAAAGRDRAGERRIRGLLLEYVWERLGAMSAADLEAYLDSRQVWREDNGVAVFKTPDEPCVAFIGLEADDETAVVVLGICYAYPSSEEEWWQTVIRPRLQEALE